MSSSPGQPIPERLDLHVTWTFEPTSDADAPSIDFDCSAFLLGSDGRVRSDADFLFYNQPTSPCGAVALRGDNCDVFSLDLSKLPSDVARVVFCGAIYEARARGLSLRLLQAVTVTCSAPSGETVATWDLRAPFAAGAALLVAELGRGPDGWRGRALGEAHAGLGEVARALGVNV
jgi:stress response protein SCP2